MSTTSLATVDRIEHVDHTPRQWYCCCGICHIITGARIVGYFDIVSIFFQFVKEVSYYADNGPEHGARFTFGLVGMGLGIIVVVCLFAAIKCHNPFLLLPHLVAQAVSVMTLLIGAIVVSYALLAGTRLQNYSDEPDGENSAEMNSTAFFAVLLVICLAAAAIQVWLFAVVLHCYNFLAFIAYGEAEIDDDEIEIGGKFVEQIDL